MTAKNPWHDVKIGRKAPEIINAIIEIPKDSKQKYELDKETGMLKLDRFLYSSVHYPGDYGFIPQTLWDDGDPLDIIILTNRPTLPMVLAEVRVVGVIRMIDGQEKDDKIIGVYKNDPRFKELKDVRDIPKHTLNELRHFFETYKHLEGKHCQVPEILNKKQAIRDIRKSIRSYQRRFHVKRAEKSSSIKN